MSSHRTLLWVSVATLIFSAASMTADRLGPQARGARAERLDDPAPRTHAHQDLPSQKGNRPMAEVRRE
jgi:hypothetical protein